MVILATFLKAASAAIAEKYIGECAIKIRKVFHDAEDHPACIILMNKIDAIGSRRLSQATSIDSELHCTLMELLNQLDEFHQLGKVKVIMATNQPDALDPTLFIQGD